MARTATLGKQIDSLFALREKISKAQAAVDELKSQKMKLEDRIMSELDGQDTIKATGSKATASISELEVPSVEDWEALYKFISRNKAWYLLQRRTNPAPYRELMEQRRGKKIPGVTTVLQRKLNLRKLPS